ncbi:MGT family glycosyltransferase [Streptomyces sp. RKND-216]|uniref:macrolide family glycosyltransferase n=1 Tax=Streptomyces sp. RKND-216 TaxID=2562581 RepID=UPI00109DB459|nr:macrolide family glycosyltransferase [Streptomyces sp. RKND-216]THA26334.1 MGT family glycosyltransferase [Streptomyces sp. RKND-216]
MHGIPAARTERARRSHVAVFTFPAYAHIAPALPTLTELVRRGHRVTCFVAKRFADKVRAAGAEPVEYASSFPWQDGPPGFGAENLLAFFEEGLAPLPTAVAYLDDDRPDLIAHDLAASESARLLGRNWNVPTVQLCPTFADSPDFSMTDRQAQEATDENPVEPIDPQDPAITAFVARQQRRLAETGLEVLSCHDVPGAEHGDNLVFLPEVFQIASETFDPARCAFVGPCTGPAEDGTSDPDDEPSWTPPGNGREVVLLSLGSSHTPGQTEFLRSCVQELADSSWHLVVTLGHRVSPDELGPQPDHVEIHQWLHYPDVLRHASAFVTHGGMGSLLTSMAWGVPTVLVPYHWDQRVAARRAAELGLGRALFRESSSPGDLRDAVDEVVGSGSVRAAVTGMRRHIEEAGGAVRGADFLESRLPAAGRPPLRRNPGPITRNLRK